MPFAFPAQVTLRQTLAVQASLRQALASGETVLDASAVRELDSTLIALLLDAKRQQPGMTVQGLSDQAQALARVYDVADLLGLPTSNHQVHHHIQ